MESTNYPGRKNMEAVAVSLGAKIDPPYQMGQHWWTTVEVPRLSPYTGTVREVYAYLTGIRDQRQLAIDAVLESYELAVRRSRRSGAAIGLPTSSEVLANLRKGEPK